MSKLPNLALPLPEERVGERSDMQATWKSLLPSLHPPFFVGNVLVVRPSIENVLPQALFIPITIGRDVSYFRLLY
jgi:hypothetical protein